MKYIDAEKLKYEIERRRLQNRYIDTDGYEQELFEIIDFLQQEQSKLIQVPRIEQETQKKGWMDYGLLISEIGLHRHNAIDRIKETKERATEIKRNIAPHDLAILDKYLESVGEEIVLCCLQQYCMDFMFTQDEVKEIIQQEQLDGLHFTPLNRLIQKITSEKWNDSTNNYAKKLRDCLIKEGYRKDAEVLQGYISYMNGNNVPMATMDEQEQPEVDLERLIKEELPDMTIDEDLGLCVCDHLGNHSLVVEDVQDIARHFYELGLKARKEE